MPPGRPTAPRPPDSAIRALKSGSIIPKKPENPFLGRYIRVLKRIGIWKIFALHYLFVILLGASIWPYAISGSVQHPEFVIKLIGTYCFLIGTIIIPLVGPDILQPVADSDAGFESTPYDPLDESDARMLVIGILAALAAIPLLPVFLIVNPVLGKPFNPMDVIPFFQIIATALWVNLLMDMVCRSKQNRHGRPARRLAVIGGFILLHLGFWLVAQLSGANPLKILIDINPFSQLFILMEGSDMEWLLVNRDWTRDLDYRLYLFLIQGIVLVVIWALWRNHIRRRQAS
ncbi:hypothetical protein KAU08_07575 [bacterium]|nr:hypothetical protein [bacterium]